MTGTTLLSELPRILAALFLVVLAAGVSRWQHLDLEKQMLVAVVRAFIQLTLIGYALNLIFAADNPAAILLISALITTHASYTSGLSVGGTQDSVR